MNTLTPQRSRWSAASSSLQVKEIIGPSGLPAQASFARLHSCNEQPEELRVSLKRLGQERSGMGELLSPIPGVLERSLFEGPGSAAVLNMWIREAGSLRTATDCVLLTSSQSGQVYLVQLKPNDPAAHEAGIAEERVLETWEPVVPDTDQAYTIQQMARAWEAIGKPLIEDDAALSVDPDDYPLF